MHPDPVRPGEAAVSEYEKPRVWTCLSSVFLTLALFAIVFQLALTLGLVAIHLAAGTKPAELGAKIITDFSTPNIFLVNLCLGQLDFGIAAFICIWRSPPPWRVRIAWTKPLPSSNVYVLAPLGTIIPTAIGLQECGVACRFLASGPFVRTVF